MPPSTVNICVATLLLLFLHNTCNCNPHSRNKRAIEKDSFTPTTLPSKDFEAGEDAQYHLKKNAYWTSSTVNYVTPETSDYTASGDLKTVEKQSLQAKAETVLDEKTSKDKKMVEKEMDIPLSHSIVKEQQPFKDIKFPKKATNIEMKQEKASFTPVKHKLAVPPKPDSKDEILVKTELPPVSEEEKVDDKITIGQVPHYYPSVIPLQNSYRLPIIIPVGQISYRALSVLPFPPVHSSDRLPVHFEDDIVGEGGHESSSLVEDGPVGEGEKETGLPLGDPYVPFLPFTGGFLKQLTEANKQQPEKDSKVVDVLGKKYVMESKVMNYPSNDNSRTFVRFMSVKPLPVEDPVKSQEAAAGEAIENAKRKALTELEAKKKEAGKEEDETIKVETKLPGVKSEKEKEFEMTKESEILKAEETEIKAASQVPEKEMLNPEIRFRIPEDPYVKEMISTIENNMKHSFEELPSENGKEVDERKAEKGDLGHLLKEVRNDMNKTSKGDFFLGKKREKEIDVSEEENLKSKMKTEKKVKRCKCEDSDFGAKEE